MIEVEVRDISPPFSPQEPGVEMETPRPGGGVGVAQHCGIIWAEVKP